MNLEHTPGYSAQTEPAAVRQGTDYHWVPQ